MFRGLTDNSNRYQKPSQIHNYVLLVKDEIMTGIIIFDNIHIEEISRGIYDCGGSVQRDPMKKCGKIIMCDF